VVRHRICAGAADAGSAIDRIAGIRIAVLRRRRSVESAGEYDYIIVGAGTAGCVLANRLTRNKHVEVLLIEAGARDDYLWIHIPVGYLHCIGNPRTDWLFNTEPDPGLEWPRPDLPAR
jgi:choline dehydrogenase-like flavoprotein